MSVATTNEERLWKEEGAQELQVAVMLRPMLDLDELVEIKIDVGLDYIYLRYPEARHKEVIRSRRFWNWWRSLWLNNDKSFVQAIRRQGFSVSSVDYYLTFQKTRLNTKHINDRMLE